MTRQNKCCLAENLVKSMGVRLLGRQIQTFKYGDWPECVAQVVALHPDPAAPEIVMTVSHPKHGEIGVFDHEPVRLIRQDVCDLAWETGG